MKMIWVTAIGLVVSFLVLVVRGFHEVGDWAISCAVAGTGFGIFVGALWMSSRMRKIYEERRPWMSDDEVEDYFARRAEERARARAKPSLLANVPLELHSELAGQYAAIHPTRGVIAHHRDATEVVQQAQALGLADECLFHYFPEEVNRLEEACCFAEAVAADHVLSADVLPETARKALDNMENE